MLVLKLMIFNLKSLVTKRKYNKVTLSETLLSKTHGLETQNKYNSTMQDSK